MKALTDEVPQLYSRREAYNVRVKVKDAVRTNFAAHMYSMSFAKLARHPRMVQPVMDLFDAEVYMHQFKINGKHVVNVTVEAVAFCGPLFARNDARSPTTSAWVCG